MLWEAFCIVTAGMLAGGVQYGAIVASCMPGKISCTFQILMNQPESKQKSGEIFEALGSMLLISWIGKMWEFRVCVFQPN